MRTVLLLNYYFPGSGVSFRVHYFAKYLSKAGYKVDLIYSSTKPWDLSIHTEKVNDNLTVITFPSVIRRDSPFSYLLRTFVGIYWALFKKYDLIHAFGVGLPSSSIPAIFARWFKKGTKIVVDWDDAFGEGYGKVFGFFSHAVIRFLENKTPILARPDAFTVVSRHFKIRLLKMGVSVEKINVIPNGADTELIKPIPMEEARKTVGWDIDGAIVLSMGHNYFGSLETLLETFSIVSQKRPGVKLKMLGRPMKVGRFAEVFDEILKRFDHLKEKIEWIGEAPREKVGPYLCAADCLLLPMENSVMDEARAPIRIGDYLASGRPVVSNAVGYTREVLSKAKPNGVCRDPDDGEEFANKILEVLSNPELADRMGSAGLELAEGEYNWDTICEKLEDVYNL